MKKQSNTFNLSEKIRKPQYTINIGDIKEFIRLLKFEISRIEMEPDTYVKVCDLLYKLAGETLTGDKLK